MITLNLTDEQAETLKMVILLATKYRQGEEHVSRNLAQEKNGMARLVV
jgi:hypothetical protein